MTARRVEEASTRLRELRQDEWSDLSLAGLAMGLALAASALHPPLALPLLAGAFVLTVLGVRAVLLRCELFDRLVLDEDAYSITEVRRRAKKAASARSRHELAAALRRSLNPLPGYSIRPRVAAVATELAALAAELEDETLELDPWCAVRCEQLATSVVDSPLLNDALPAQDLLARINQIRSGFHRG